MPMSVRLLRPRAAATAGFDPRSIGNMVLWLDANDASTLTITSGAVEEWRNKAGTAHVSQSVANNRPAVQSVAGLNNRSAVFFDGSNDVLLNTTSGLIASAASNPAFTLIVAHRPGSISGAHCVFDIAQGGTYAGTGTIRRFFSSQRFGAGNTIDAAYMAFGGRDATYNNSVTAANTSYIHSLVTRSETTSATNPIYYRNGTSSARVISSNDGVSTFTPSRFSVGSSSQGASEFYIGHIAEVCVYTSYLTDAQRQAIERYLGTKYGITVA